MPEIFFHKTFNLLPGIEDWKAGAVELKVKDAAAIVHARLAARMAR